MSECPNCYGGKIIEADNDDPVGKFCDECGFIPEDGEKDNE